MKTLKITINFVILLITLSVGVGQIHAQTPTANPPPLDTFQQDNEALCTKQTISVKRTYTFRELPRATVNDGAFGAKKWYKTLFPFLKTTQEKYGVDSLLALKTFGIPAPEGESKRSLQIRGKMEKDLSIVNPAKSFDWSKNGIDVGEVGWQGFGCNTCWAFATMDAMQISRQLYAKRANKVLNNAELPSVRQLASCMVQKDTDYCEAKRLDQAFNFMVEKGLPIGGTSKWVGNKSGYICDADDFVKALTWDFVSGSPHKVASTDEIKRAVLLYGGVIASIHYCNCFGLYGGGIFNEEQILNAKGEPINAAHMVLITGWDDEKQAWLIKNSYGIDWGENGFGWIKYKANNIGQFAAFIVADPKEEERIADKLSKSK